MKQRVEIRLGIEERKLLKGTLPPHPGEPVVDQSDTHEPAEDIAARAAAGGHGASRGRGPDPRDWLFEAGERKWRP